jgi:CRISPR/Cas system CSM-associated protein Csm3 (group 7 of RAMP superfamily)
MSTEKIVIYKGKIRLTGEFHSTSVKENEVTDHPLVRDTEGRFILRGESLAGMMRRELVRYFGYQCQDYQNPDAPAKDKPCNCQVCRLMGHSRIPESLNPSDELNYHSSRMMITGGIFKSGHSRIRHGVAIDRRFSVAAQHKKYDSEGLLRGAACEFSVEIQAPTYEEIKAVEWLFSEAKLGFLSLGGKKGAGFGGFEITVAKYIYDLNTKEGVKSYLLREYPEDTPISENILTDCPAFVTTMRPIQGGHKYPGYRIIFPFDLWLPELFLVNDPLEAALLGSDHVSVVDEMGSPWLPPSTIRGVIRSRCEMILRTIKEGSACDPSNEKQGDPLRACSSHIEEIRENKPDIWPTGRDLEAPNFLCMACQLFGCGHYGGRIHFHTGAYKANQEHDHVLTHFLAIDRFKGGGKDGAKFDAWPIYDVHFSNCKLILEDFETWHIGLVGLVFKDLFQGDMRMGFGTRKGFGQVVGRVNPDNEIMLSTPDHLYSCRISELLDGSGIPIEPLKNMLENAVSVMRKKTVEFGGAQYGKD